MTNITLGIPDELGVPNTSYSADHSETFKLNGKSIAELSIRLRGSQLVGNQMVTVGFSFEKDGAMQPIGEFAIGEKDANIIIEHVEKKMSCLWSFPQDPLPLQAIRSIFEKATLALLKLQNPPPKDDSVNSEAKISVSVVAQLEAVGGVLVARKKGGEGDSSETAVNKDVPTDASTAISGETAKHVF